MSDYVTLEEYDELWEENKRLKADARESVRSVRELQYDNEDFRGQVLHMREIIRKLRQQNNSTKQDVRAEEAKAADLQQQLLTFKGDIAALTRTENQLTDDEVRQKMDRVFYGIQNFFLQILRGKNLGKKSHRLRYQSPANPKKTASSFPTRARHRSSDIRLFLIRRTSHVSCSSSSAWLQPSSLSLVTPNASLACPRMARSSKELQTLQPI